MKSTRDRSVLCLALAALLVPARQGQAALASSHAAAGKADSGPVEGFQADKPLPDAAIDPAGKGGLAWTREGGRLTVTLGGKASKPNALVLFVFQPGCLQCESEATALQAMQESAKSREVLVVGIANRGEEKEVRALAERLKIGFPLVVGSGSDFVRRLGAGDPLCIADHEGIVRFAQVGYGGGDEKLWATAIESLLAGKPVETKGTDPERRLEVGDRLPTLQLDSLTSKKPVALTGEDGKLVFRDEKGATTHPKAAVGFFSRY